MKVYRPLSTITSFYHYRIQGLYMGPWQVQVRGLRGQRLSLFIQGRGPYIRTSNKWFTGSTGMWVTTVADLGIAVLTLC